MKKRRDEDAIAGEEFDNTFLPENMSDEELVKSYVALMRLSIITRSRWLDRIIAEMSRRGIGLPN